MIFDEFGAFAILFLSACVVSAMAHLALVVPRLPPSEPDGDDQPPHYPDLATWPGAVGAGVASLVVSWVVLTVLRPLEWLVWFGYLGAGAALVWVDLRTTWLPRRLNNIVLAQVMAGLVIVATLDWRVAVGALLGGVAAFLFFHLIWRLGEGLGYGDVRLAGIVGLVAGAGGLQRWAWALVLGTLIGALWAVVHWARTRARGRVPFPYGPSLWLGPVAAVALL